MHVTSPSDNRSRRAHPASRMLLVLTACLVAFAQPLAALAAAVDCGRCEHGALEGADCCCAPTAPADSEALAVASSCCSEPVPEVAAPPVIEEGCCAEPSAPSGDPAIEASGCSCRSLPTVPVTPPQPLPPTQDLAAARQHARLVADGLSISARSLVADSWSLPAPGVLGGIAPPPPEAGNGTRLVRAAVQGTPALLSLLSVARL